MRTKLISMLALCSLATLAQAETIVVDGKVALRASNIAAPSRGMPMKSVEERFGAPATRHNAVGQPPISRWDYAGFSVYFEFDRVIHAVTTGG